MASVTNTDTARALPPLPLLCFAAYVLYLFARAVYRLYLHPLSKFPGPRTAAITTWYEAYYEVVLKGQYSRQITKLHEKYGRMVSVLRKMAFYLCAPGDYISRVTCRMFA